MSDVTAASAAPIPQTQTASASTSSSSSGPGLWSHGSFSFKDVLDIINPLQHIPVIGSVYRYLTGDEPSGGDRIIGDALYGGPIGFGASVVSTAFLNDSQGHDIGERLLAKVFGSRDGSSDSPAATAVASAPSQAPAARTTATANSSIPATSNPVALASASAPMMPLSPAQQPAAGVHAGGQPVAPPAAMSQIFHGVQSTAAPAAKATPEQTFMAQTAQFQHQVSQGRGADGSVISGKPVPLELSSNLLPVMPAGGRLTVVGANGATTQITTPSQPSATNPAAAKGTASASPPSATAVPSPAAAMMAPGGAAGFTPVPANPAAPTDPIAQKMMDALAKYQQMKQQEDLQNQQDNADPSAPAANRSKVDLAL